MFGLEQTGIRVEPYGQLANGQTVPFMEIEDN